MKMIKMITVLILGSVLLTGCGSNSNIEREKRPVQSTEGENISQEKTKQKKTKILIAYFTRSDNINVDPNVDATSSASVNLNGSKSQGNLTVMANYIQKITGGDTFSILTSELYPSEYRATTNVAKDEQNNHARPKLSNHVDNMEDYDVIYLGYPIWWGDYQCHCTLS